MSSQIFENLRDDFRNLISELRSKIDSVSRIRGEERKIVIQDIERVFDEAKRLLPELEDESEKAPNPYRIQMMSQARQHRQQLEQLSKQVLQLETTARQQLFSFDSIAGGSSMSEMPVVDMQRTQLLRMNDTLSGTTDSIVRSHRLAAETDQVGTAVIGELETQREVLVRTKERLVDADDNLKTSRKILRSMYRKVITNKLILIVIILLELGILGGVVYYRFFTK